MILLKLIITLSVILVALILLSDSLEQLENRINNKVAIKLIQIATPVLATIILALTLLFIWTL